MYTTRNAGVLALALALAACSDAPTTAPATSNAALAPVPAAAARKARPVPSTTLTDSPLTDAAGNVVGSFTGTATLSHVVTEGRSLIATILFNGTAVVNGVTTTVSNVPATTTLFTGGSTSTSTAAATTNAAAAQLVTQSCPVLDLAIGQIHLNLLGLDVTLSAIDLDIVAQAGPGALVGNLLCAVVHLLDGPTGGAVGNALANLLDTINGLLGGLL